MDTSDNKGMLMRKVAIFEFLDVEKHFIFLTFESLSIYCQYQKRLAETICYSEILKPNILLRKLKQRKKKRKKKEALVKCQCRSDR